MARQLLLPLYNSECVSSLLVGRNERSVFIVVSSGKVKAAHKKGLPLLFVDEHRQAELVPQLVSCLDSLPAIFAHGGRGASTLNPKLPGELGSMRPVHACADEALRLN